jgi:NAD(P)-dependent dehydrogenase (short-subunit alcohol dehydrogenase family)
MAPDTPGTPGVAAAIGGRLLEGKVAVVTGGAGGIGRGISDLFAAHGAAVVVVDIDEARAAETVADIVAGGGSARAHVADVTDASAAATVVPTALAAFGRVDVLVNNVGHFLFPGRPFVETKPDEWLSLYRVNLEHVLRLTQAVLPPMIDQGTGGSIINLSTVEAFRGIPQHPVYAAFKAGVTQFGRSLALDVGRHGIRINDIAPDVTRSRQLPYERWLSEEDTARIPTWVPLGRLGEPRDTAGVALFLASDLGAFVTGTTVHCDGGTYAAGGWYPTARDGRGWTNRPFDP